MVRPPEATPKPQIVKPHLKRSIGLLEATVYGVGIIFGAGIYVLIGEGAGLAGNSLWLAFAIAAIVSSFTALSYAELSSLFPKAGAEYVYAKNASGSFLLAFIIGWIAIFAGIVSAAAVALGFSGYFLGLAKTFGFAALFSNPLISPIILIAILLLIILSALNFWGIKESARLNVLFTAIETGGLLLIIFLGISFVGTVDVFELPEVGFSGIFAASALIFFAYIGFEDVANISEETRNPKRIIPLALLISLIFTTIVYMIVSIVAVSVVPAAELAASEAPLALIAAQASGTDASLLLALIALFATLNTVLIILVAVSRMLYGIAHSGRALPKFITKVHKGRSTPYIAIVLVMFFAILFVFMEDIGAVASITNFGIFLMFIAVNASVIAYRYKNPEAERIFRVPLNIGKFPILPAIGILISLFMLAQLTIDTIIMGSFLTALAIPIYLIFTRLQKQPSTS